MSVELELTVQKPSIRSETNSKTGLELDERERAIRTSVTSARHTVSMSSRMAEGTRTDMSFGTDTLTAETTRTYGSNTGEDFVALDVSPSSSSKCSTTDWLEIVSTRRSNMNLIGRIQDQIYREIVVFWRIWKLIIPAVLAQYVHSVCSNLVYFFHRPGEHLIDVGFYLFPDLGEIQPWDAMNDTLFFVMLIGILLFLGWVFVRVRVDDKLLVLNMLIRFGVVAAMAQMLRCISFLSTILPSPAIHCQPGNDHPPTSALQILFRTDAFTGCGDLIFSSHTLLVITMALTFQRYNKLSVVKVVAWAVAVFLSFFAIASRSHYTVDVVIAWYVTPMIWFIWGRIWKDVPFPILDADRQFVEKRTNRTATGVEVASLNHV
eukprot:979935_1